MSKTRPQVKNKRNDWYDWLVNHVSKTVKDKVSRAFKTFKDKIMGLYNRVTGSGNHTQLKGSWPTGAERPATTEWDAASRELEPIELEEAFDGAYRNNKKRSHTQLDSRKQVIAFQDRVITINIKEAQHPLK